VPPVLPSSPVLIGNYSAGVTSSAGARPRRSEVRSAGSPALVLGQRLPLASRSHLVDACAVCVDRPILAEEALDALDYSHA
jgi:hypothetical protein